MRIMKKSKKNEQRLCPILRFDFDFWFQGSGSGLNQATKKKGEMANNEQRTARQPASQKSHTL